MVLFVSMGYLKKRKSHVDADIWAKEFNKDFGLDNLARLTLCNELYLTQFCNNFQAERLLKREREYDALYSAEVDKAGLASIRELHSQLDDDKDGSIEPSETGDFIRADLKASGGDHR